MINVTKPMLAETIKEENLLKFPVFVSPKLDGIRCIKVSGKALTRKFKPIPNHYIRNWIEANMPDGFDGELMIPGANFNDVQSAVMSRDGEPTFEYHVFDFVTGELNEPFQERYFKLKLWFEENGPTWPSRLVMVPQIFIGSVEELLAYESDCLSKGYEGVMTRAPEGGYKCGRSTVKQAWLLKLKRFQDDEALVIGFEELMHNENEKEINELGLTKRSTKKEGMVPADTLGKFLVRDLKTGVEFECGTGLGLTQELRKSIWENKDRYLGKLIKYKHQPVLGAEKPRFPVWLGFRSEDDL